MLPGTGPVFLPVTLTNISEHPPNRAWCRKLVFESYFKVRLLQIPLGVPQTLLGLCVLYDTMLDTLPLRNRRRCLA